MVSDRESRQWAVIGSLLFASVVSITLLLARGVRTDSRAHFQLLWNLLLAWLPMLSSLVAFRARGVGLRSSWLAIAACAALWLLFFPNAPYIVTDILHLRAHYGVPVWYDLIMLSAFAWTGTFLGLVSLYLMQALVHQAAGRIAGWLFAVGALGLGSFGVYLGRFLRFNSWDVLFSPLSLLGDIWKRLQNPLAYSQTLVFSALFALFLASVYFMLVALMHLPGESRGR